MEFQHRKYGLTIACFKGGYSLFTTSRTIRSLFLTFRFEGMDALLILIEQRGLNTSLVLGTGGRDKSSLRTESLDQFASSINCDTLLKIADSARRDTLLQDDLVAHTLQTTH